MSALVVDAARPAPRPIPHPPAPAGRGSATDEPPFVGRARELGGLLGQLGAALTGDGGVALLVGEPGIGKTRTLQRLAGVAQARGARVLWGRGFDGEWAPPFGPWVDALGRWAAGVDPRRLREDLGSPAAAAALGGLVPAIRAALPDLPPPAPLAVGEERARVHDAVAALLLTLARRQPLLLVLDDLHWADPASLALLRHAGRGVAAAPILFAASYRREEVDHRHPLAEALAGLRREADAHAYCLAGLSPEETSALLARLAGEAVAPALAAAIHASTGGNPFFARELFRHLAEEDCLTTGPAADGLVLRDGVTLGAVVPEGVRQVVGRRLARLGEATNRMLGHAAIATGGFDFRVLQALTGLEEAELLDALDEALASGLVRTVDERRETYDFVHAIVRHTLAAEWSPSRKVRLHRRLAEALERVHAGHVAAYAAELAVQYHASAALPGAGRGVAPALAAADAARAATDREGAARFLRIAHDLAGDLDPTTRAGILAKLALAEADALLLDEARRTVEAATTAMARAAAPPEAVAGFLGSVAAALEEGGAPVAAWQPLVERGLALLGDRRDQTWARLTLTLKPFAPLAEGPIRAARWLGSDPTAVAIARAGGEEEFARTVQPFDDRKPSESRALLARARGWQRPEATIRVLTMVGADWLYHHGDLQEAIVVFEELLAVAGRHGSLAARAEALIRLALARATLGQHETARRLVAEAEAILARLGPGHHLRPSAAWVEALLADHLVDDPAAWAGIARFWQGYVENPAAADNALVVDDAALAAYAFARAAQPGEASRLLAALAPLLHRLRPNDWLVNGAVAFAAAAVWWLATAAPTTDGSHPVPECAPAFRALARSLVTADRGDYPGASNDLALARMAVLVGDRAEAGERFARARLAAAATGRRPLRAIVDYDEALALLRWGGPTADRRPAALLAAAEDAFRALGMDAWAARAAGLARTAARPAPRPQPALPAGLTEREVDVLRLIARGHSDRTIGDRLFLSPRTVNAHVRNMLRKTDRANRTELSIWAVEQGIVSR